MWDVTPSSLWDWSALKARIAELEQQLESKEAALAETTEQYELAQLARKLEGSAEDGGRADELKELINEYIREIDQCLKLIGD